MNNLTQKEKALLQDQKTHEEICVKKYNDFANQAQDPQLKQLFGSLAQKEQKHLDTVNKIISGQVPNMNQSQQQQGQQGTQGQGTPGQGTPGQQSAGAAVGSRSDADLCNDMLMTEKYVSGAYDTAIFECKDTNVRHALNHLQKEEQEHGESIFKYMESKGLYNPQ